MSKKKKRKQQDSGSKLMKRFEREVDIELCNQIGRIVHGRPGMAGMTSLAVILARVTAGCTDSEDSACVLINELCRFAHMRTHVEFKQRIESAFDERSGEPVQ